MAVNPHDTSDTNNVVRLFMEASLDSVPEWIPLLPTPGVYPHPAYGQFDLRQETIDKYVANFNSRVYGQDIPLDLEHELRLSGAMANLVEVRANEDGSVDARVDWNERGRQVVTEGRFGYVSPMLYETWTDPVSMQKHDNVIIGAALTKRPFFKEGVMRPLIVASEPVNEPSPAEGITMSDQKTPAQEGTEIVERKFGEMLAERDEKIKAFAERVDAVEAENASLKAAAQERTFREQLAGVAEIDARVKELAALPADLHEGYIKRAQSEVTARKQFTERKPVGSDALGDGEKKSATAEATAKAAELMKAKPELTQAMAFSEVMKDPDLKRRIYDERAQA